MPEDACQYFYKCKGCGVVMKLKKGDCCVFCSYGDVTCPSAQQNAGCCGKNDAYNGFWFKRPFWAWPSLLS